MRKFKPIGQNLWNFLAGAAAKGSATPVPSQPTNSPAEQRYEYESTGTKNPPPMLRKTWRW